MDARRPISSLFVLLTCFVAGLTCVTTTRADFVIDDFDGQAIGNQPANYHAFGIQLSDSLVSNSFGATSGTNSAVFVIDFSKDFDSTTNEAGFGIGAEHMGLNLSIQSTDWLSVNVRLASSTNSLGSPFIAFRLTDSDGTIWRTPEADLFSINNNGSFGTISQRISGINYQDELAGNQAAGTVAGLDLNHITTVGLIFYDKSYSGSATIAFDDLRITAVPEPASLVLVILTSSLSLIWRQRRTTAGPTGT